MSSGKKPRYMTRRKAYKKARHKRAMERFWKWMYYQLTEDGDVTVTWYSEVNFNNFNVSGWMS